MAEANVPGYPVGASTYDVHVIAVDTAFGEHGTSLAHSTEVVRRLDKEYDRETNGFYRFRMGTFQTATVTSGELCDLFTWRQRFEDRTPRVGAGPGATAFTWVVVAPAECAFTGQAMLWGRGVHMASAWDAEGATSEPLPGYNSARAGRVRPGARDRPQPGARPRARPRLCRSGRSTDDGPDQAKGWKLSVTRRLRVSTHCRSYGSQSGSV